MKKQTARLLPLLLAALLLLTACGKDAPSGAGTKSFTVEITFSDGSTSSQEIETDKETVGEALESIGLIDGEIGAYGLYITTVGGETVKYEDDGHYWSFYINGEYAATGVDSTETEDGATYAFRVE
ncbi:MAG: DUF4430 domain-containing protein [Butyricicoccus sp.]|nr:DUF4430 domain-containing protein [Butyricicoccus sp.]